MTVERENVISGPYFGDGVAVVFPFDFHAIGTDEVSVQRDGVEVDRSSYVVTIDADGTGSVSFFTPPVGQVILFSNPSFTQEVNFENQGPFYQASVNEPIDRSAVRDIYLKGQTARALKLPMTEDAADLPGADERGGRFLAFDAVGSPSMATGTGSDAALRSDLARSTAGARLVRADAAVTVLDRLDQQGRNVEDIGAVLGQDATPHIQALFDGVGSDGVSYPTVRLPGGKLLTGTTLTLVREALRANVEGQGIDATIVHHTGLANTYCFDAKNFAGGWKCVSTDAGAPEDVIFNPETDYLDISAARAVPRSGFRFDWFAGHGNHEDLQARWYNGAGFSYIDAFDFTMRNLIVRDCGQTGPDPLTVIDPAALTDAHKRYAFEMRRKVDTCNHFTLNRLQVEDSYSRAIFFDRFCLNGVVDGIHCEGTIGELGVYSVVLHGTSMSYRNGRFANDGGNFSALLGGVHNVWDCLTFEGGQIDFVGDSNDFAHSSVVSSCLFSNLRVPSASIGNLVIRDCEVVGKLEISDQSAARVFVTGSRLRNVKVTGNVTDVVFESCIIDGTWEVVGNPTVRLVNCMIAKLPTAYRTILEGCIVTDAAQTSFGQQVYARSTEFRGGLALKDDNARAFLDGQTVVTGNLGYVSGTAYGAMQKGVMCSGTIAPQWYGTGGGNWPKGTYRAAPPVSGSPMGHTATSGSTFVADANYG